MTRIAIHVLFQDMWTCTWYPYTCTYTCTYSTMVKCSGKIYITIWPYNNTMEYYIAILLYRYHSSIGMVDVHTYSIQYVLEYVHVYVHVYSSTGAGMPCYRDTGIAVLVLHIYTQRVRTGSGRYRQDITCPFGCKVMCCDIQS